MSEDNGYPTDRLIFESSEYLDLLTELLLKHVDAVEYPGLGQVINEVRYLIGQERLYLTRKNVWPYNSE